MPTYRRAHEPGGTFFFTLVTENRARFLCGDQARQLLRAALAEAKRRWPFRIDAIVLLPDHLHAIWTLPPEDADFSTRWSFMKGQFTRAWLAAGGREAPTSASRKRNRRRGVWQRRFWEHMIRDERDFERHCDYIHYNAVKHSEATCPHAWPFSTFRQFVRQRIYARDWQCGCNASGAAAPAPPTFDGLDETAME